MLKGPTTVAVLATVAVLVVKGPKHLHSNFGWPSRRHRGSGTLCNATAGVGAVVGAGLRFWKPTEVHEGRTVVVVAVVKHVVEIIGERIGRRHGVTRVAGGRAGHNSAHGADGREARKKVLQPRAVRARASPCLQRSSYIHSALQLSRVASMVCGGVASGLGGSRGPPRHAAKGVGRGECGFLSD